MSHQATHAFHTSRKRPSENISCVFRRPLSVYGLSRAASLCRLRRLPK
ncbi:hypothetical protein [Kingella potus]|nr:hypothetical protein [Kingella potus]UOP01083.1 hypothetical protein LVJ84_01615 [Kingella potus]